VFNGENFQSCNEQFGNERNISKKIQPQKKKFLLNQYVKNNNGNNNKRKKKERDKPYRLVTLLLPSPYDVRFLVSLL